MTRVATFAKLSRLQALGLVIILWAGIYLPALGSLEIKGEEGRRILPGVAMLDTGQWIVPTVGGVPFLNKPPLINWLVAAAFRVTGTRSEWAARAPSALVVLALALTAVWTLSAFLTPGGALLAAIFALTNIGLMEKGRLAEIEALYLSLYGIALLLWLGAWQAEGTGGHRTPLRTWTLPWIVLGIGLLAKGPLHVLFFYAVVVAVLACAGRLRELWNWAHLLGFLLMLGIFAAWAVPYFQEVASDRVGGVWLAQFQGRLEVNEGFHFQNWLLNIPRGLINYLPWVVLLPLAWRPSPPGADAPASSGIDLAILRGLRWALVGCFLAVSLAPGGQPRYTLPLLVPASVLIALTLRLDRQREIPSLPGWLPVVWARVMTVCGVVAILAAPITLIWGKGSTWRWGVVAGVLMVGLAAARERIHRWNTRDRWVDLGVASAVTMGLFTIDFALGAVPRLRGAESVRPVGRQIDHAAPGGEPIAVLQPGFVPFLFYLGSRPLYLQSPADLPPSSHHLLVRQSDLLAVEPVLRARNLESRIALRINDKRLKQDPRAQWLLLRLYRDWEGGL